jgi:hypothetical protein
MKRNRDETGQSQEQMLGLQFYLDRNVVSYSLLENNAFSQTASLLGRRRNH